MNTLEELYMEMDNLTAQLHIAKTSPIDVYNAIWFKIDKLERIIKIMEEVKS